MNRKWMPKADQTKWTPLDYLANLFESWLDKANRPNNGALMKLVTADGKTDLVADNE